MPSACVSTFWFWLRWLDQSPTVPHAETDGAMLFSAVRPNAATHSQAKDGSCAVFTCIRMPHVEKLMDAWGVG